VTVAAGDRAATVKHNAATQSQRSQGSVIGESIPYSITCRLRRAITRPES
jgi:hypothetical protein